MTAAVPSLEGTMLLKDPQSIIAYILRKYFRTPRDTIPILSDIIISLPWQVAQFGKVPDTLCSNIRSDLQNCYDRIFNGERTVTVSTSYATDANNDYDVTITVMYALLSGELSQTGTTISLKDGRLVIPEDILINSFL